MSPATAHMVSWSGEFVGTFMFLFIGYGCNIVGANQASENAVNGFTSSETILFIGTGYAVSLAVNVWVAMRISGSQLNPAVTWGQFLAGNLEPLRGAINVSAQLLASVCAGLLAEVIYPGSIGKANTTLGTRATTVQGLFMELFFTAQLMLIVLFVGSEKSKDSIIIPISVGLAVFAGQLAGVGFTGASLNPARSFGCAVASQSFPQYHWIYWLGPVLGASIAAAYYRFTKYFKDQDGPWEPAVPIAINGVEMDMWHDGRKGVFNL
ncbi:aquaporin-like protein [Pseudomassariella vexata]|uniref:Aquaporin-like protein n=1 Tax=Pseudomassariella vexata TaxID=1141098 RepID=A0A1Y2DHI8_9PEZI|nr:aquaporin-like protein [Pseudomassariella vexata]ORY58707.1 aquaporin-like protein [Pseudomassariella vexata]